MEDENRDKVEGIEDHLVLKCFEYFSGEIPEFPPKRDIYFSIYLVPGVSPMSKTLYRMGTPEIK
jgi:hypothetical protein